jgi:hypothetical protein
MRETPLPLPEDLLELETKYQTLLLGRDAKTSLNADKTPRAEIWPFLKPPLNNNTF